MRSHFNSYMNFCHTFSLRSFPLDPLVVSRYVAYLTHVGCRFGTIQNHLSSRSFPLGWEQDYVFNLTLKGGKRYLGLHTNRKQAITSLMLHRMATPFNLDIPLHTAMWALFLVAGTPILPKVLRRGHPSFFSTWRLFAYLPNQNNTVRSTSAFYSFTTYSRFSALSSSSFRETS